MKYTKGEWKTTMSADGSRIIYADDEIICRDVRHYNMNLVAAAPDMYEALKMLIEHITMPKSELGRPYLADVKRMANKALAKAEGK